MIRERFAHLCFARQYNRSHKRLCRETIGKFSASIIIEQAVTPLRSAVFYKAPKHVPTIFYTRRVFHVLFFSPFSSREPYKTQMSAFFVDGFAYMLPDVPRCLPFYRDISKAFRISLTIREAFFSPQTIYNYSSPRISRHMLHLIMIEGVILFGKWRKKFESIK